MIYAGVDIHKNFFQTVICKEDGEIIKEVKLPADVPELLKLLRNYGKVKIAFEATANYEFI